MHALGQLPGAAAVDPTLARVLLDLAPTLSTIYRLATPSSADRGSGSVPGAASDTTADLERRWLLALDGLVAAVADEQPIALVIDDLHWADSVSLRVLHGAIDRGSDASLLVVTTARPGGPAPR